MLYYCSNILHISCAAGCRIVLHDRRKFYLQLVCIYYAYIFGSHFFVLMNLKSLFLFLCAVVKNFDLVGPNTMSRISKFKDVSYIECIQFLRSTQLILSLDFPLSWLVYCMLSL